MRLGILSDVHGNLAALEAALATLRRAGVDRYVCAGDLVGYGPQPNECVEVVAALDALCVAGNHDLIALGRLSAERCIPLARRSLEWTRHELREDTRRYLEALPLRAVAEGEVLVSHGSVDDPQCYVRRPEQAEEQLARMEAFAPGTGWLILGHTHRAWAYGGPAGSRAPGDTPLALPAPGPYLLNPGSVGQSRERACRARCLLLDLERRTASFYAVPYDTAACREALRRRGLPVNSCHLAPSLAAACAGRARRLAAKALAVAGFRRAPLRQD